MERYLGADVHAASVTFCGLDASGKQIRRDVVETNGKALVGYLQSFAGNLHLCIEEASGASGSTRSSRPMWTSSSCTAVSGSRARRATRSTRMGSRRSCHRGIKRPVYKDAKLFTALRDRLGRTRW